MNQNDFEWLQDWYKENCDGNWEHQNGVTITTIDNPGWSIEINLQGTQLEDKRFNKKEGRLNKEEWWACEVKGKIFSGRGGPTCLDKIFRIFRDWVCAEN